MRKRSPAAFVALALLLSVPFLVLGATVPNVRVVGLPLGALQFLAPFAAALILVGRDAGRFLRNAVDISRLRKRWLVPALVLLPAIYGTSALLMLLFGRQLPPLEISVASLLSWSRCSSCPVSPRRWAGPHTSLTR